MTSSTASNSIMASLARNTPSHRSILTSRSIHRSRALSHSRRIRSLHRRRLSISNVPVTVSTVDVNNNSSTVTPSPAPATPASSITLDRVAIMKAFAASQTSSAQVPNAPTIPPPKRPSRYEKPTSYREARRLKHHSPLISDPAINEEFIRLRDSVPSIAGSNVSDLTIINEAISLICDLESQLLRKLKMQQSANSSM